MTEFTGTARVYDREEDAFESVSKGNVDEGDVIVIRYEGPKGGPGMREMLQTTGAIYGPVSYTHLTLPTKRIV